MSGITGLAARKKAAREAAFLRRELAHRSASTQAEHLTRWLLEHPARPIAGYMPMRSEIDPLPAMEAAAARARIGVPVIEGAGRPLRFREWTPGCALEEGHFGAHVPVAGEWITPEIVIVPLVAFDRQGHRLGYGGGFYDRTLERLRAAGPVTAVGFAFAAQEADEIPVEPTDQPLDLIVTETGIVVPG
ncbi:5-formyltetrahydrofolate cyclo-ligase [Limimaricola soesokkakensis]|uniref:5-formyltetrahydrofolate cyclo-ligase n=1 Tax=Limimaricola soesokkakensis TaxID=1343159 RepID=A0A1X6YDH1_9RHOB|nr:5-formyltetrahydrofolate cyclo-ligase [Limimaricola soesokkakensis]PSK87011.1 5-formyltetrahydrofolate cyclo-ligase [Limimaricola soesokkakensis]SLN17782.1 putative 5-formyltetrahydrofolate cyclo-ligase [Limimaricola soesokkakensis]